VGILLRTFGYCRPILVVLAQWQHLAMSFIHCFAQKKSKICHRIDPEVLAVVYVLLGRAVSEYRWGGSHNILFMRHKFLVLTVKELLKSVYIYGSYRKIKTGLSLFWTTRYSTDYARLLFVHRTTMTYTYLHSVIGSPWQRLQTAHDTPFDRRVLLLYSILGWSAQLALCVGLSTES